jgi:phosphopantothenate---cysteine ligase (CTP)
MKVLVTAGATREPIDAVRFLSNVSTGATGAALTEEFLRLGHAVVHLHGAGAVIPRGAAEREGFLSASDLRLRLERRLASGSFDVAIMAAAVADYRPAHAIDGKLSSDAADFSLRLVRNDKILPHLKAFSPRPLRVVGFKLTVGAGERERRDAVATQFTAGGVDAVVHNDLEEIRTTEVHPFWFWTSPDTAPIQLEGVTALAGALAKMFTAVSLPS